MPNRQEFILASSLPPTTEHVVHGYNNDGMFLSYESFDVSGDSAEMTEASAFRDQQKEAFLQDAIRNPILNHCPNFHLEQDERRSMYLSTRVLMMAQGLRRQENIPETLEDRLLNDMISLRINEIGYIETAALIAEGNLGDEERLAMGDVLKRAGREIYGMPDPDRAFSLIDERLDRAREIASEEDHPGRDIAQELLSMVQLPEYNRVDTAVTMDAETTDYYRRILHEVAGEAVDYAFAESGEKDEYDVEEMRDIFERYMDRRGYLAEGWKVQIVQNRTMCAAKAEKQVVEIGDKRSKTMRKHGEVLKSLLHEVEAHAGRHVRGKKLGSGLAEYGLPGYGVFEEPLADAVGSLYEDEIDAAGVPYTMGLAIAAGYDGQERDFRDTHEVMWRIQLLNSYKPDKPMDEQILKARTLSYSRAVRIWRGMPTDVPGCVFPKDRNYENSEVVDYLGASSNRLPRQDFVRLLEAKYNPLDPDQDEYIRSLTT